MEKYKKKLEESADLRRIVKVRYPFSIGIGILLMS